MTLLDETLAAMKPFVDLAEAVGDERPSIMKDSSTVYQFEMAAITLGDCKNIRAVYAKAKQWSDWQKVECSAVVHHGPGHQSKTHCQRKGPHTEHYAMYGSYNDEIEWEGDSVFAP